MTSIVYSEMSGMCLKEASIDMKGKKERACCKSDGSSSVRWPTGPQSWGDGECREEA